MTVGNIVTWTWQLKANDWEPTRLQGLITNSRLVKTDREKVIIFDVLLTDGTLCEVREDDGLEMVA